MENHFCLRDFARYTILSVLGTLGVSCYILADTFFVSKGLGTRGLTALNLAIPVYNFIHGTGLMLGMGGATRFSVCKNQGRKEEVNRLYMNTLYLSALFSLLFFLSGILFAKPLAVLLGADETVLEMTGTYLRWLFLFSPAFILNDVFLCFVRNDEAPRLAMVAMLIGSFSNILLDYVFIFPMGMGIFGAVFATGLSPVISIAVMSLHWIKKRNSFHFCRANPLPGCMGQELSLGFPSLIAQVSSGVVIIVFNAILLKLEGNIGVAAYGVIANISLVIVAVYTGIAQGAQPLISRFYATGDQKQVQKVLRYATTTILALSCIIYVFIYLSAGPVTAVFNSENDPYLQRTAITGLKLYFISNPFVGYNIILAIFFTSIEKALPAHILSLLRGLILIIPMAFLLSAVFGITGVWLTYPVTELLVALPGFVIIKKLNHKNKEGKQR